MSDVLTGKGPQPPSVYWIRRGVVALVALVALGLLIWVFVPKNQPTTATPAQSGTPTAARTVPSPTASPTGSPSGGTAPTPSPSPTEVAACEAIGVQLTLEGFRSVKSGSKQVFSVTAENNTAMPCVMEITKDTFTLRVVSGKDLIWSTGHCEAWLPKVDKQTLKAGASVEFKSTWALYRSASSCKQAKSLLGAGTYVASALYKETATDRFAFTITK